MNKAIFLDKDGTLIPDIAYNVDPDKITLMDNAVHGLQQLTAEGYLLIIISNQSGVARGYFAEQALASVFEKIDSLLALSNVFIHAVYYCPHYDSNCDCRKPQPGLILKAAKEHDIHLESSWMIGDILNDVEAGNRAGCSTVLIDNGNETEWLEGLNRTPTLICRNINEAAEIILQKHLA